MELKKVQKALILLVVFLYPFTNLYLSLIQRMTGLSRSYVLIMLFLLLMPLSIAKVKYFITSKRCYYLVVLILSLSLLWSTEYSRGVFYILVVAMAPLFGFNIYNLNIINTMWKTFSYSTILFSILLQTGILIRGYDFYDFGGIRFGYLVGSDVVLDPNWLGAWLAISFMYFFIRIRKEEPNANSRTKLGKAIDVVLAILSIYFLLRTGSMSSSLGLGVALSMYVFSNKKYLTTIVAVPLIILVILLSMSSVALDMVLLKRLSGLDLQSNSRIELVVSSSKALTETALTFLFGYGAGGGDKAVGKYYSGAHVQEDGIARYNNHNTYLDMILQLGGIGFFIVIVFVIWAAKVLFKSIRIRNNAFILVFSFILVQALFYNPIKNGFYVISWGLAQALSLSEHNEKNIGKKSSAFPQVSRQTRVHTKSRTFICR